MELTSSASNSFCEIKKHPCRFSNFDPEKDISQNERGCKHIVFNFLYGYRAMSTSKMIYMHIFVQGKRVIKKKLTAYHQYEEDK